MPATAFDTLQFAEGLKVAGTPAPQADATARLLADALSGCVGELATHAHLREGFASVEHRLDAGEHRLDAVEHRLDAVEHRLDAVEQGLARCVLALHGQARDLAWLKRGNLLVLASLFPLLFKAFV